MKNFQIHRLNRDDAEAAIAALDALLPPDWREGALPSPQRMAEVLADKTVILIAASAGGVAAGYVSGHVLPAIHRGGTVVMLDDLFVAEPHRGRGLGCELVDVFRAEARQEAKGPASMWSGTGAGNIACRRAFEAAGGTPDGETYKEYHWREV